MKKNEYRCEMCGGIFEKGWTDEEALEEYKNIFGEEATIANDNYVVCDDCYHLVVSKLHQHDGFTLKLNNIKI